MSQVVNIGLINDLYIQKCLGLWISVFPLCLMKPQFVDIGLINYFVELWILDISFSAFCRVLDHKVFQEQK